MSKTTTAASRFNVGESNSCAIWLLHHTRLLSKIIQDIDSLSHQTNIRPDVMSSNSYDDILNSSKDTDDSTLNQSGGCELIGIFENSDHANSSNDSPRVQIEEDRVPYVVQYETTYPSSIDYSSTPRHSAQDLDQDRITELEKLTTSLSCEVERLKDQLDQLSKRSDAIESLIKTRSNIIVNDHGDYFESSKSPTNSTISRVSISPHNNNINGLSKSINSLTHTLSKTRLDSESKSNISRVVRDVTTPDRHNILSPTSAHNSNQARNSRVPIKKGPVYASASSLYHDNKSNISSRSLGRQQETMSRNSHINGNRESKVSASMLSLSSMNNLSMSTSAFMNNSTADSTSNISQVCSALTSWPSTGEYISTKSVAKEILFDPDNHLVRMMIYNNTITMQVPNWINSSYDINEVIEPPNVNLKLNWVHGYRGKDCRCNIFYLPTGECVYFVASIIVLYNPEQRTQRHYLGHTDTVKCLAVHPNKLVIASGQSASQDKRDRRPIVRVWNTVSLVTMRVIGFNEDFDRPICCLAFSKHDSGATLAVVDESNEHTITLLDWQRQKNWRIAEANSGHEPVFAIDFHPIDKYSLVAVGKSTINFWDIRGMTLNKKAGLFDKYDKPKYVLCLTFNDIGETVTGDSNGNIMVWPRGGNRPKKVISKAHQGGVFSVIAMKDGTYLSGGRDRRVLEWDENFTQTGRVAELPEHYGGVRYITYARGLRVLIGTLKNCILLGSMDENFSLIMQGHSEAISAIAIHPTGKQFLTGGFDEQIHMIDSTTNELLWTKCLMTPATAASFSPNEQILIIGSTQGQWFAIDPETQEILFKNTDGSATLSCIKFSPSGQYFAMGSADGHIYIYNLSSGGRKFAFVGSCVGHSGRIKDIDWSTDGHYFQSQSMNFDLMYWVAKNCKPLEDTNVIEDLDWSTHNCIIGFSVMGIWTDTADSSPVNDCDKSYAHDLLVAASDSGYLDIFKWPACYNQCLPRRFPGNVEKFNFVRFINDDSKIVAIGSKNCATTIWTVSKNRM